MIHSITCLLFALAATVTSTAPAGQAQKETSVTKHASGTFEVRLSPQGPDPHGEAALGRMSIDKRYHGDLEGSGLGQMLAGMGEVKESGAYVAIERVRGTLHGRAGTFAVHHRGIMTRGAQQLVITVVPDSGTGDLAGITGTMTIDIKDGKHFYTFDYSLP